jgi:cytochrome P450
MWIEIIVAIPVVIVVLTTLQYLLAASRMKHIKTKQPILSQHPLRCYSEVFLQRKHFAEHQLKFARQHNYQTYVTYFGPFNFVIVNNPESAKKVLLNTKIYEKDKSIFTPHADRLLGTNVLFSNGEEWNAQRRVMNPAFYNVDRFAKTFLRCTKNTVDAMVKICDKEREIDVPKLMTAMTLDILGDAAFGYKFNNVTTLLEKKSNPFVDSYHYVMENMITVPKLLLGKLMSLPGDGKFESATSNLETLIYDIIRTPRNSSASQTLLDLMKDTVDEQTGAPMSEKRLRDNMVIMFIAGHDTTSSALSYALYTLAKYPEIQEKVIKDLDDNVDEITAESLEKLEYLSMFIKENLRVYPPVPNILTRNPAADDVVDGFKLPKGQRLEVSIYTIHHNKEIWGEDADEFRPERFSEEESKGRHPYAWMPFGMGPRKCLGNTFSLLEQKIFLAFLLKNYRSALIDPNYVLQPTAIGFLMGPAADFRIKLVPRQDKKGVTI